MNATTAIVTITVTAALVATAIYITRTLQTRVDRGAGSVDELAGAINQANNTVGGITRIVKDVQGGITKGRDVLGSLESLFNSAKSLF